MKKLFYSLLILGMAVLSCNKPDIIPAEQEISFKAAAIQTGFKTPDNSCNNGIAHYALLTIQPLDATGINEIGDPFNKIVDVFYLNSNMFTNTFKLPPGKFKLTAFILKNNGPDNKVETGDEIVVYASPSAGSIFGNLASNPLPLTFSVDAFLKKEVKIEVICFKPADFDKFGFTWFALDIINVTTKGFCFFGDICLSAADLAHYKASGNLYKLQTNGIMVDMPAIFRMKVSKWNPVYPNLGTPPNNNSQMWLDLQDVTNLSPKSGESFPLYGEGAPLCVQNYEKPGDIIRYSLWVYMKETTGEYWNASYDDISPDTPGFRYKFVKSWWSTDTNKPIDIDNDGIIDFVIGSCNPDADLKL